MNFNFKKSFWRRAWFQSVLAVVIALVVGKAAGETADYEAQLTQARLFSQPLMWVGTNPPAANETYALYQAVGLDDSYQGGDVISSVEAFVSAHTDSPWTPSLEANLARYYYSQGRYSDALADWKKAWLATRNLHDPHAAKVFDFTVAYWSQLLSSLGRMDELKQLVDQLHGRQFHSPQFQRLFDQAKLAMTIMKHEPEVSYRCGTLALFHVAKALGVKSDYSELAQLDSPVTGFSLSRLIDLSAQYDLGLRAVKRPAGGQLVVPSVVHWSENHYAAIVAQHNGAYEVIDPTFGSPKWLSANTINENASGYFMVPTNSVPHGWVQVSKQEAQKVFGKGLWNDGNPPPSGPLAPCGDDGSSGSSDPATSQTCPPDPGCGQPHPPHPPHPPQPPSPGPNPGPNPGPGHCSACSAGVGMPYWEVQEPYISLWLHDRPMVYNLGIGRQFILQMDYHQRETRPSDNNVFNFGPGWNCSLLTYVKVDDSISYDWEEVVSWDDVNSEYVTNVEQVVSGQFAATEYCPDGGEQTFTWGGTNYNKTISPRTHMHFNPATEIHDAGTVFLEGQTYTNRLETFVTNTITYPNGSIGYFDKVVTVSTYPAEKIALLTKLTDPNGHSMYYDYTTNGGQILLTQVVDYDGHTNKFMYGDPSFPTSITQVTNTLYHLGVNYSYDNYGYMTNITDVEGISSSFTYSLITDTIFFSTDGSGDPVDPYTNKIRLITDLHTPYGHTTFDYFHPTWPLTTASTNNGFIYNTFDGINRAITVVQPDGGTNLFMYRDRADQRLAYVMGYCLGHDSDYDANYYKFYGSINAYDEVYTDNSFYWGPRQCEALSTTVITNFVFSDFELARNRNWLHSSSDDYSTFGVSQVLNAEIGPKVADTGGSEGQTIWYGYEGKYYDYVDSTNDDLVCSIGYAASDAFLASHIQNITRNSLGYPTEVVDVGSDDGCNTFAKTNKYIRAANGIDLIKHIGPDGVTQESYSYDNNHHVLSVTNALHEVTRYTYNGNGQITSVTLPNNLVTTNIYGSDGFLAQEIVEGYSTNSYTYTNGLVFTHTDERGLTTTNTWDALQRLTKVAYPDGTSLAYYYSNLDVVKVTDRMNYSSEYTYDSMRRRTAATNALQQVTLYGYCTCGSLEYIRDAAGNFTYFYYDNAGRLTNTVYPDGYTVGRTYSQIGALKNVTDSGNNSVNYYYDGELQLTGITNLIGGVAAYAYDINGLITNQINADGVSVSMTYDDLHRLLTRTYPDDGVEKFGYTPGISGPTSFTNQINNVVLYAYDGLNRKTNEIYVGVTTNKFAYNAAGDLLRLTDGENHTTSWGYDDFGRVTNKLDAANHSLVYQYDADNHLTNRWSEAKGSTYYTYDAGGNLTYVNYPSSPDISLSYDALNQLTNMVDAVGTTVYGYSSAGQLLSENGPWASDTMNYTYQNRLRTSMSISAPNGSAWTENYTYDAIRRIREISSPAGQFTYNYGYDGVHALTWFDWQTGDNQAEYESYAGKRVFNVALPGGAYITNTFDNVARLTGTWLMNSGDTNLDSYTYGYNQANQRTNVVRTTGDYVNYTYDNMGELKTAMGKEAGGVTNRWQEQFGYTYDAAGNLNYRTNNTLLQQFNVNNVNELTTVSSGGRLTVAGSTTSPATNVTVNTSNAVIYADIAFASTNQPWVNGNNTYTAIAKDAYGRLATNSISVSLSDSSSYTYDNNGNLTSDGTRNFAYDDENQLIAVWEANSWSNNFLYDGKLRRRITRQYDWNGSAWQLRNEVRYMYDGNVVVQERNSDNLPLITYTRGIDMSGTLQGAGGIGGLLARTDNAKQLVSDPFATALYHADGNGNVTCLIYTNQTIAAKYLYGPFGNTISVYGALAKANSYRFSSKEWDADSGLYYYLYRFYDSNLQRWLSRDPALEIAFHMMKRTHGYFNLQPLNILRALRSPNLYQMVMNSPIDYVDIFGLVAASQHENKSSSDGYLPENYNPDDDPCGCLKDYLKDVFDLSKDLNTKYGTAEDLQGESISFFLGVAIDKIGLKKCQDGCNPPCQQIGPPDNPNPGYVPVGTGVSLPDYPTLFE